MNAGMQECRNAGICNPGMLVLGGARSGKSTYGQRWVETCGPRRRYVATAVYDATDVEMAARIARHREERAGRGWVTAEAPLAPWTAVDDDTPTLIDCATLWLFNVGEALGWDERLVLAEADRFAALLAAPPCPLVVVSNEVGQGIVPETPLGRTFRDLQGWVNQRLAAAAQGVVLVVAGLPLTVKAQESA